MSELSWMVILIALLALGVLVAIYPLGGSFKRLKALSALMLIVGSALLYWQWGAWESIVNFSKQQDKQRKVEAALKAIKDPQDLVVKLKQHLQHEPKSARGWYLLGRLYASQGKWSDALSAFSRAHELDRHNEQITINYAQSLWEMNRQQFSPTIRDLFQGVLSKNPNQPDALSMLAIDAYQNKAYSKALEYWGRLLRLVPPDSAESKAIRQAMAKAEEAMNRASH